MAQHRFRHVRPRGARRLPRIQPDWTRTKWALLLARILVRLQDEWTRWTRSRWGRLLARALNGLRGNSAARRWTLLSGTAVLAVLVALFGLSIPSAKRTLTEPSVQAQAQLDNDVAASAGTLAGRLSATRIDEAEQLLKRQAAAVLRGDRQRYLATIDPRSKSFAKAAARTYDNLRRLKVADLRFSRPAEDAGGLTPDRRRELGGTAWLGEVETTIRLAGVDAEPWVSTLRMVFVERNDKVYLAADREGISSTQPLPLWITDEVTVVRGERSLVVGTGSVDRLRAYARTADRAVPRVTGIWGEDWAQYVVILVPRTQREMERLIGAESGSQSAVAAVTTSVGRASARQASHIVVNPSTFGEVGPLGRLVVLTHETTHVASHATVSGMPMWLSEGFADYVGFKDAGLSMSVVAEELFDSVRAEGAPDQLPDGRDFDPRTDQLDRAYESAWLACRYLATHWSEEKLVEFYRAMDQAGTKSAQRELFPELLGVSEERFVQGWREYLEVIAD